MRILNYFSFGLLIVFTILCGVPLASAQTDSGTVAGRITDASGAVVPNAEVDLTSVDRGVVSHTKSNSSGIYVLPSVAPGIYNLSVSHAGFRQVDLTKLVVNVQSNIEQNFKLQVGSVSESVTVTAGSQQVETGGAVSTVIDHTFIENMPLNGNSLSTLFELTPGVVTNAGSSGGNQAQGGGLSVNGQRGTSNYLTLDGASENIYVPPTVNSSSANVTGQGIAVSASGGTNGLLPIDAVEEYRIQTSTYSAEFGRTPGGQIGIRTRGGTNEFHGSVFENFRNQVMDATDYFIKFLNETQTPLRMNDFGGTLGGPILKNKLFFFVAHETLLMTQPQPGYSEDVPSTCAVQTAASVFQPFLKGFPVGNAGPDASQPLCNPGQPESSTNQPISDIFNESYSTRITDHSTSARLDADLPWRSKAFFRFNIAPSNTVYTGWNPNNSSNNISTFTGGITSQVTQKMVNEVTINYSRNDASFGQSLISYGGNDPAAFTNAVSSIANPATTQFQFNDYVWTGYPTIGPVQDNSLRAWNAIDTVSWTLGRHSLKFGADYLWRNPVLKPYTLALSPTIYDFSGIQSGILDGLSYSEYYSNPNIKLRNLSFFANDTWRITKALTLNYGVRWEINPSPSASGPGLFAVQGNVADSASITEAPAGSALFSTVYTNFAPRIGASYLVSDDPKFGIVLRGGFGIFYDTGTAASAAQAAGEGYPYMGNGQLSNVPYSSINWKSLVSSTPSLPQSTLYITDPDLQAPRTYQWSVTLEQKLGSNSTLTTSYVGNTGHKLASTVEEFNFSANDTPLIVSGGDFKLLTNGASSNYQSLQMQFRSRIGRRLDAIASWTWAHNIDSGDSDFAGSNTVAEYSLRSDSSNDIRHIFSAALHYSPTGVNSGRTLSGITSGWSLDTIALLQTASPISVYANLPYNPSDPEEYEQFNGLASIVPGIAQIISDPTAPGGKRLNPAGFSVPNCLCNGNSIQNGYRLFGLTQWDMAANRSWKIWRETSLTFRVDAFNILNIASFANVNTQFNPSSLRTFGEARNTYAGNSGTGELNPVFQNGGARSLQLSAKIKF
ncbi:TonB-dependent receptor [Paracidobacterium acidisoli]|uniref:Carboxypeptidase regulatory-like domain-containing protein n=1 Tax=Paracidobacterium acidisoli TaxID=2303751 RepID=A0A372IP27_9BACT|nr:TonB-dependent receptor [Paracidobacterium acidisoli]MBT9331996.1 TonB-dependent receptor [Paracidobacterium acidisoli]